MRIRVVVVEASGRMGSLGGGISLDRGPGQSCTPEDNNAALPAFNFA